MSSGARKDSWLSRQPTLLTAWLVGRNAALLFLRKSRAISLVALTGGIVVLAIWVASRFSERMADAIEFGTTYVGFVPIIAVLHAATLVSRRRRHLQEQQARSWLIATPGGFASSDRAIQIATFATLLAHAMLIALTLIVVGILSRTQLAASLRLLAYAIGGLGLGGFAGWYLRRSPRTVHEASRYVPKPVPGNGLRPRGAALSRLPIAQTLAWNRPENLRVVVVVALLSVQAGSSMLGGLSVVAAWLVGNYLAGLLRGIVHVGRQAAQWLRPTPISFATFAWSVSREALLHQVVGTVIGAGVITLLGSPPFMTLYLAAMWMTVVCMVSALSLADCYRNRSATLKLAFSFITMAGIESRAHGWAIPFALGLTVWHLHRGARA